MDASPDPPQSLGLADYVRMVRERWLSAGLVFLLVVAAVFGYALLQEPVFAARSSVQIDLEDPAGGLSSLFGRSLSPQVQSEVAVMRSRDVALFAAKNVRYTPWVETVEVHAHRPLEAALGAFGMRRQAAPLRVRTEILDDGRYRQVFTFVFGDREGEVTVYRGDPPEGEGERIEDFAWGQGFTAFGRGFEIDPPTHGPILDRAYVVTIRSAEETERWIRDHTKVESGGSNVLSATFHAQTPEIARDVANAIVHGYRESKEQIKGEMLRLRLTSLDTPIKKHEKDRRSEMEALDTFLKENDAYFLERKISNAQQSEVALAAEMAQLRGAKTALATRKERLSQAKTLNDLLAVVGGGYDPISTRLWREYDDHLRRRTDLVHDGAPLDSPAVKKVDADIEAAENQLIDQLKMGVSRQVEALDAEMAGLDAQIQNLQEQDAERASQLEKHLGLMDEVQRRRKEIEVLDTMITQLRREQSSIRLAVEASPLGVRLLDLAELPDRRVSPDLLKQGLLAMLLGALLAFGAAFLFDRLDQRVRSAAELQAALGLPVLAVIPDHRKVPRRERKAITAALPAYEMPRGVIAESYRMLRAKIRFADREGKVRTLAITSPMHYEGKTQTSLNLAVTIAQTGRRVLLVDADMRRASLHLRIAPLLPEPLTPEQVKYGLSYVLENGMVWKGAVLKTRIPELDFLPAGAVPADPGALLDSSAFVSLLDDVKNQYDYVFFDVPPALAVADAASFYARLDAVVLLARYRHYKIAVARKAKDRIVEVGGRLLGCVLNAFDVTRRGPEDDHYYHHYSYYSGERRDGEATSPEKTPALRLRS